MIADDLIRTKSELAVVCQLIEAAAATTPEGNALRATVCRHPSEWRAFYDMADRIHAATHVPKILAEAQR